MLAYFVRPDQILTRTEYFVTQLEKFPKCYSIISRTFHFHLFLLLRLPNFNTYFVSMVQVWNEHTCERIIINYAIKKRKRSENGVRYMFVSVCLCACVCISVYVWCVRVHVRMGVCVRVCVCMCMCMCMCVMCLCLPVPHVCVYLIEHIELIW